MIPRVILLGASNVVREPWLAVETARQVLGEREIEVLGAYGHGRSYGMTSRVLGRSLPGILQTDLWRDLDELPAAPTYVLVMDIGNDIVYGADSATLIGWIEECLERLARHDPRLVLTGLPTVSLERLNDTGIALARRLLFPTSPVTVKAIRRRVLKIDRAVRRLAARYGAAFVEPRGEWYGIDPIHIRRSWAAVAWAEILASWQGGAEAELSPRGDQEGRTLSFPPFNPPKGTLSLPPLDPPEGTLPARRSLSNWTRLRFMRPESWRILGWRLGQRQPAGTVDGSVRVSLY